MLKNTDEFFRAQNIVHIVEVNAVKICDKTCILVNVEHYHYYMHIHTSR